MRRFPLAVLVATAAALSVALSATAADGPGTVPLASKTAEDTQLSPGQATWVDATTHNLNKRSVALTAATITLGNPLRIAEDVQYYFSPEAGAQLYSTSGLRTAYRLASGSRRAFVTTENSRILLPADAAVIKRLSGMRVLYLDTHGDDVVFDLKTRKTTNITATYNVRRSGQVQVDLFGNYVVFATKDFRIWRKNLSSSAAPVLIAKPPFTPSHFNVTTYGDWVAWSWTLLGETSNYMRDARTMGPVISVENYRGLPTSAGLLSFNSAGPAYGYTLQPWGSTTAQTLPLPDGTLFAGVDGHLMTWIDPDTHLPKAAPLDLDYADRPRSLGNPISWYDGTNWHFDLVASAPLTSCTVTFTKRGVIVAKRSCKDWRSAYGEMRTFWSGATNQGKPLPHGTYRWILDAANADGTLLRSDGVARPTTGTLVID